MSLEEQIINQYNKRKSESLYSGGLYSEHVDKEIYECISGVLKSEFNDYRDLNVLEIGAGNGSNAEIFVNCGFQIQNIYFNELLPERINAIKSNYPNNTIFEGNAIEIPIDRKFDIIFQSTVFTSILNTVDRKLLAEKMLGLLNPGGIVLWYDFIYNNPKNKDVRKVDVKELKSLFSKSSGIYFKKITLAPPIGRKVGRFYKLFNVPFLRSHILAVIKK
ncbi:MAG: class I SAM-dependent methyltransferase [Burkholderiales bacterium]|nr:class I SAM-dependent methyltransferase [Bacteroidia bacterium]